MSCGNIKVGHTNNVGRRLKQHKATQGDKDVSVLGVHEGNHYHEQEILRRFSHLRIGRTEQLEPSRELMNYIDAHTEPWNPRYDNWEDTEDWLITIAISTAGADWYERAALHLKINTGVLWHRALVSYVASMGFDEKFPDPDALIAEPDEPEDEMLQLCGLA